MSVFTDRTDRSRQPATAPRKPARSREKLMTEETEEKAPRSLATEALVQEASAVEASALEASALEASALEGSASEESDIEEVARIRLQHSHYRAIRRVNCAFANGILTLTGAVPTFHYKQLAQTAVVDISGVRQVVNLIDVG